MSAQTGSNSDSRLVGDRAAQSERHVRPGSWVNLNYPDVNGLTSSNSVSGNQVVGIAIGSSGELSYEATVKG